MPAASRVGNVVTIAVDAAAEPVARQIVDATFDPARNPPWTIRLRWLNAEGETADDVEAWATAQGW